MLDGRRQAKEGPGALIIFADARGITPEVPVTYANLRCCLSPF